MGGGGGGGENWYRVMVGGGRNSEGERPYTRPSCKWEDNNKMNVTGIGWWSVGVSVRKKKRIGSHALSRQLQIRETFTCHCRIVGPR